MYMYYTTSARSAILRRPLIPIEAIEAYAQYPFLMQKRQPHSHRKELPQAPKNLPATVPAAAAKVTKLAAESAFAWLSQSKELQSAADSLMDPIDDGAVITQVQAIVDYTKQLKDTYNRSANFFNPTLTQRLDSILDDPSALLLGISRDDDESWELDAFQLISILSERPQEARRNLKGSDGIVSRIHSFLAGLEQQPAAAMLSSSAPGFQAYTMYQSTKKPVLQVQMKGLFVNSFL